MDAARLQALLRYDVVAGARRRAVDDARGAVRASERAPRRRQALARDARHGAAGVADADERRAGAVDRGAAAGGHPARATTATAAALGSVDEPAGALAA